MKATLGSDALRECYDEDGFVIVRGPRPQPPRPLLPSMRNASRIAGLLGYRDWSVAKIFYRAGYMGQLTGDWVADMQSNPVLVEAKGPFNSKYRYYTEDTGVGLVVVHSISRALGLPMPTYHTLIHLRGIFSQTDYFAACTRSLEALGIRASSPAELKQVFAC